MAQAVARGKPARGKAGARQSRGQARGKRKAGATAGPRFGWLAGVLCGALATLAPAVAFCAGVLLLPGLLAWMLDRVPGRHMSHAVLGFGAAAATFPLLAMWRQGGGFDQAMRLLADPTILSIAWLAGAFGWSLSVLLPLGVRVWLDQRARTRARALRAARRRHAQAWILPAPNTK